METKLLFLLRWQGEQLVSRIELEGMLAENAQRLKNGLGPAYPESEFVKLRDEVARNNAHWFIEIRELY